ncbi:hypothetical protein AB0F03_35480 [Streptomyces sp. NPDC028722]|uniref:hypothetical protein n=1 Tax=Streptomyces sp. NPDC028722 TaxID=3155016 RepID=UPI003402BFA6
MGGIITPGVVVLRRDYWIPAPIPPGGAQWLGIPVDGSAVGTHYLTGLPANRGATGTFTMSVSEVYITAVRYISGGLMDQDFWVGANFKNTGHVTIGDFISCLSKIIEPGSSSQVEHLDGVLKLAATHDSHGHIVALVASDANAKSPRPQLQPGQYHTEIIASEMSEAPRSDMKDETIFEQLEKIRRDFRVEVEKGGASLMRRSSDIRRQST